MNRSSFALFVALVIHGILILAILRIAAITPEIKKTSPQEKRIKVSLRELPKPEPIKEVEIEAEEKNVEIAEPVPKGSQLKEVKKKAVVKKVTPKKPIKYKPKAKPIKPKLNSKPKPEPKKQKFQKTQPLPPVEPYIPYVAPDKPKEKKQEDSEMSWLLEDKSSEIEKIVSKSTRGARAGKDIRELYGDEFGSLSVGQQQYIVDNKEAMRRITQSILNRQASVANIHGLNVNESNIVEFYLHPNGDMTGFRFLKKSGYFVLDDITKATMEYSYSKYPRPEEKTLIRYDVFYNLKHY